MDVISAYLETMFSPYPHTPRLSAAKAELREMMEDAYQAAIAAGRSENEAVGKVITEFGNLDELAPVLGIASELRPGASSIYDDGRTAAATATTPSYPPVTMAEAQGFAEATRRTQPILAIAVALFVISPSALIALSILGDHPRFPVSSDIGIFAGIVILLIIVLIGVGLILSIYRKLAPYSRISERRFTPEPAVTAWAQQVRAQHEKRKTTALIASVSLWILSALPVIASSLLEDYAGAWGEYLQALGVPMTLTMVAVGLLILLPTAWADSVARTLSQEPNGSSDDAGKESSYPTGVRVVLAILWPVTVIVYLLWSFLTDAWHISWIIWPVAGLLSAAIGGVGHALARTGD